MATYACEAFHGSSSRHLRLLFLFLQHLNAAPLPSQASAFSPLSCSCPTPHFPFCRMNPSFSACFVSDGICLPSKHANTFRAGHSRRAGHHWVPACTSSVGTHVVGALMPHSLMPSSVAAGLQNLPTHHSASPLCPLSFLSCSPLLPSPHACISLQPLFCPTDLFPWPSTAVAFCQYLSIETYPTLAGASKAACAMCNKQNFQCGDLQSN